MSKLEPQTWKFYVIRWDANSNDDFFKYIANVTL